MVLVIIALFNSFILIANPAFIAAAITIIIAIIKPIIVKNFHIRLESKQHHDKIFLQF